MDKKKEIISSNFDKRGFYIATLNGEETSIYGESRAEVESVAQELVPLIKEQFADDRHYGLAFYACGYDGEAQQRFCQSFGDVTVF